jgi:hypothetical protein
VRDEGDWQLSCSKTMVDGDAHGCGAAKRNWGGGGGGVGAAGRCQGGGATAEGKTAQGAGMYH